MFLNISKDVIIRTKDIVGVFNLDYIKNTKEYRNFLSNMMEQRQIVKDGDKQEKTFILTQNEKGTKGYITNISTNTIGKRKRKDVKRKLGGKF